jgi:hypothetical protein
VADRHGIGTGLLYTWCKQMLTIAVTGFAAVEMVSEPGPAATHKLILLQEHPDPDCLKAGHDVSRVMIPEHTEDASLDPGGRPGRRRPSCRTARRSGHGSLR